MKILQKTKKIIGALAVRRFVLTTVVGLVVVVACSQKANVESLANDVASSTDTLLNLSLSIFPMNAPNRIQYTITIINDSITAKEFTNGHEEYKGKLTNDQYFEIKELASALTSAFGDERYYSHDNVVLGRGIFGCMLAIDHQVYFHDNICTLRRSILPSALLNIPPVKLLVEHIIDLFNTHDIPIFLPFGFQKPTPEEALQDSIIHEQFERILRDG